MVGRMWIAASHHWHEKHGRKTLRFRGLCDSGTTPQQPPELANNAGNQAVQLAVSDNEAKKRDWAILNGFMKGISDNIRDALDLD